ncbi:hypothetical protein ATPR_2742 [Acetobacter tropicalis NBRC 101654]|uniref:Auto-transporter adhesin head GIN domain-containing protein n=1 Tax=Acetobacter tropicalis NBRC 101654 TaxID=749388 RepID=F7VH93_9PROT|nr:hypothetical protein [Acetobacter tropicalis]GAA09738.1 hypothetical protein ATPR_2742 [Acetobacter tropicalis NBRC 101654]
MAHNTAMMHSAARLVHIVSRAALILPFLALATRPAHAAVELDGKGVSISTPCLTRLHVAASTDIHGAAQLPDVLPSGVTATVGKDNVIYITQTNCTAATPLASALTVTTRPTTPLTIDNADRTAVLLDDRKSTVFIRAGSAPVEMGKAGELGLVSTSTGPITIRILSDSARIRSETAAPVTIRAITAPALALYLGGSATFTAQSGHLQALEITSASTGNAVMHGTTDVGVFHVMSSGSIIVDKVGDTLATERDGSGKIIPDASAPPPRTHADRVTAIP